MTIINGNMERARLKRESSYLIDDKTRARIYINGSPYKNYDEKEKYVAYRLSFLSPTDDSELYFVLRTLFSIDWFANEYQQEVEAEMIEEIYSIRYMFFESFKELSSDDINDYIKVTGGDILLHWASKLSFDIDCSLATACEMLLSNLGLILPVGDERLIRQAWNEFEGSDYSQDCNSMFDQEYYEYNSSFYCNGRYLVPDWWEQYQSYLCKLLPEE